MNNVTEVQNLQQIKPVSAEEFSSKIISSLNVFHEALAPLIFPLASIGITVSLLVLLMGGATGSKELKKIGGGGIVTVFTVTIFYYLYPLLLGLFGSAANVL